MFILYIFRENQELDMSITQLCGQENDKSKILFNTYWERIPGVNFRVSQNQRFF